MSGEVEKINFLSGVNELSETMFSLLASAYTKQTEYIETLRKLAEKISRIRNLYDLPGTVVYENGEPVIYIELTGSNLERVLNNYQDE